ncbi:unnamed protein product [Phyllotreta striolata]|uniref:RING-type E3 ubiquitin transferase n=1 Tax=Phyllotreta striolata TaxID=444603 RepID=A0A9N9XNB7_PHYSR|nr:unnamed protein product [Phyllotreta striolata]
MLINISTQDETGKTTVFSVDISKKALVCELKAKIADKIKIKSSRQRLIYFGKSLEDSVELVDYKIIHGGTIILSIRPDIQTDDESKCDKQPENDEFVEVESKYYKKGDFVDVLLSDTGAWYEGVIQKISINNKEAFDEEKILFNVISSEHIVPAFDVEVYPKNLRPRSYYNYKPDELQIDLVVLANYNLEDKKSRGLWYDFKINELTRTKITGTIHLGNDEAPIEDCSIEFRNELMRIEEAKPLADCPQNENITYVPRKYPYYCDKCLDDKKKKCDKCGCKVCKGKENYNKILLCDECDDEYHTYCLDPPLENIPDDDWYCPTCKVDQSEIMTTGEFRLTKRQAKMPNKQSTSTRDWGKGMACAGRSTICTIVPKNHFGPIPGIDVGTRWMFRVQVSEAGVHRPSVSGIHGVANEGAFSLVLSGGYEDDVDTGYEFLYTGSGGRDLSGNKRVNVQSCDQTLTGCNKALALNCHAAFNEKGAHADDWTKGKPIRVVRNYKARKHSKYAPLEGNRYDGIYKVVKYYPEKGLSGFIVWKYLLRRDDPAPAPWEKAGQELDMIYPPLYLENRSEKKKDGGGKRKKQTDLLKHVKKAKLEYTLPDEVKKLIEKDKLNSKYWNECSTYLTKGKSDYLVKVQEMFTCICCQDLVFDPVTLECTHSFCKGCMKRSFKCKLFSCPCCRGELGENYKLEINENFSQALKLLFPGYGP